MNSFAFLSDNLISWWIQVSVIAIFGVALPYLFRIRHPKTQLRFYQLVLALCVLIPLIEPWHHPLLVENGTVPNASKVSAGISWGSFLVWIVAAGILVKLCWLAVGVWHVRRYRASAMPVFPVPESIRQARILTHSDARFGLSRSVDGPATLGHVDPIILLPESFLILDHDAQLSIACHELIHVRRNDWIVTLFEEIIGTLFWFHPAVWALLSQTKLSREQLVDTEVVALTEAPAQYVQALLAMAGAPRRLKPVSAAFFLTDGHLPHRVRSLLTKRRGSISRLAVSYGLIACLLIVLLIGVTVWFPLTGAAYSIQTAAQNHILPPSLIARTTTVAPKVPSSTFNVRVPVTPAEPEDVVYSFSGANFNTAEGDTAFLTHVPPPPPSILRLFRIPGAPGVRMFRPGEIATSEDIARLRAALGESAIIEVMQAGDGTVQRLTILSRRSPDESSGGVIGFGISADGGFTTGAAGTVVTSDSVH